MRRLFLFCLATFLTVALNSPLPVHAMGSDTTTDSSKVDFEAGKKAVYAGKYDEAIKHLIKSVKANASNADAYNYLGFAYRKKGDLKLAAASYKEVFFIDPNHKGALEYQGEMYLKLNDLKSANANLAKLTKLCPSGCKELAELKRAIADYAATRPAKGS